jgi:hypothetical protein
MLQQTTLFNTFVDNLLIIPKKFTRFWRGLPTRLSAYRKDLYNRFVQKQIAEGDNDVFKLLDAMDAYATLSNEASRHTYADHCLTEITKDLQEQKKKFSGNLIAWIEDQHRSFAKNLESNYIYIKKHLSDQQVIHNLICQFSGPFAKIECQLLAAEELAKRRGVPPIIGEEVARGGFYSVHAVQWDLENNLVVKKLLHLSAKNEQMAALEAHYHRVATRLCSDYIVPLLHIYENNINDIQRELWLIMPRYAMSLQQYLMRHIHDISFARVISFALTIAKALAEFHRLGIVHRDLKASNIMLDVNEQCYIIDFGTAKIGLFDRTILGTLPLPPEMVAAHIISNTSFIIYDGAAADVYCFGLLLYEMLPKPAYERLDTDALSRLEELLGSNHQSDVNIKAYEDLIRMCLNSTPTERPSAAKLVSELQRLQHRIELKPCMVCEDAGRTLRFVPCGHKVICTPCWETWSRASHGNARCIVCNAIVTNQIQDDSNATFYHEQN